jgi:hypothetical protein
MKLYNDASPPLDDDDNEKDSKIQRTSKQFLIRSVLWMMLFIVVALTASRYLEKQQHLVQQTPRKGTVGAEIMKRLEEEQGVVSGGASSSASASASGNVRSSTSSNNNDNAHHPRQPQLQQLQQLQDKVSKMTSFQEIDNQLASKVDEIDKQVRARKRTPNVIMETDEQGLRLTKKLQEATLELLKHRYGYSTRHEKFRVKVDVVYPDSITTTSTTTTAEKKKEDYFYIDLFSPIEVIPCSVFYFMEIVRTYESGNFHRNAGHVLQAEAHSKATKGHRSMPFQEYSDQFQHIKYTTGYAGRPSGPGWYVSIQDNSKNHGPGSQQEHNPYEADSIFGKLSEDELDHNIEVVQRIHTVPQRGWLDRNNYIKIPSMTLMVPSGDGWIPWTSPGGVTVQMQ